MTSPKLTDLTHKNFDVVIVGGGIVGAGLFRDLSLHGVNTLLIDKKDFASQTSHKSSKMLHGGIRYLENMDFDLVHEALHEKNIWVKLAPHLTYPAPFYLPVYKHFKRPLWQIKIGLMLYDLLSQGKNPPHKSFNQKQSLREIPQLRKEGLSGVGMYYDAVVDDARLCLENIYDGQKHNSDSMARNYVELLSLSSNINEQTLLVQDTLSGEKAQIKTKNIIFALGPFTDQLLTKLNAFPWNPILLPSKGSHIWLSPKKLPLKNPVVLTTEDGRIIFAIAQDNKILVGTTELPIEGDFFDLKPNAREINYLLKNLNYYFPGLNISEADILSSFSGVRPLIREGNGEDLGKTSREHKIVRPGESLYVIAGGKYTTFRVMAQEITREITHKFNKNYSSNKTLMPLKQTSCFLPFRPLNLSPTNIQCSLHTEIIRTLEDLVTRRMGIPHHNQWPQSTLTFDEFLKLVPQELVSSDIGRAFIQAFKA